jgi:N-acylglucosamine-6-phosphate 2-epimerase
MINRLKNKVVVSVQAMPSEPLYAENCTIAMMKSVVKGGAGALRVAGARDVRNAKQLFDVPVIGLTKPEVIPANWQEIVYITPTIRDVLELVNAGADIVAFDGTSRHREHNDTLEEIIKYVKINKRISMADISTVEEGLNCEKLGANILSTTLSGYTQHSPMKSEGPDFELLEELVKQTSVPVVLEGRIWEPEEVNRAFELGAHCVVIGSAITRPQLITRRFINRQQAG